MTVTLSAPTERLLTAIRNAAGEGLPIEHDTLATAAALIRLGFAEERTRGRLFITDAGASHLKSERVNS